MLARPVLRRRRAHRADGRLRRRPLLPPGRRRRLTLLRPASGLRRRGMRTARRLRGCGRRHLPARPLLPCRKLGPGRLPGGHVHAGRAEHEQLQLPALHGGLHLPEREHHHAVARVPGRFLLPVRAGCAQPGMPSGQPLRFLAHDPGGMPRGPVPERDRPVGLQGVPGRLRLRDRPGATGRLPARQLLPVRHRVRHAVPVHQRHLQRRLQPRRRRAVHAVHGRLLLRQRRPDRPDRALRRRPLLPRRRLHPDAGLGRGQGLRGRGVRGAR